MGGVNVKNTMVERGLQIIAPHPCFGCGKVGAILCDDCKYDITHEPFVGCILCGKPNAFGICRIHDSPIDRAFTIGTRSGVLEDVINQLKFHRVKGAARPLAELLHEQLPSFSENVEIVPIPTVRSHVRQRGYDQVELIVQHFASLRTMPVCHYLERMTNATQHVVGKDERLVQAEKAFSLKECEGIYGKTVLLIDDIVTTGATLQSAATLLKNAGATVWVATLAYQPLD